MLRMMVVVMARRGGGDGRDGGGVGAVLLFVPEHVGMVALEHEGVDVRIVGWDGGVRFFGFQNGRRGGDRVTVLV